MKRIAVFLLSVATADSASAGSADAIRRRSKQRFGRPSLLTEARAYTAQDSLCSLLAACRNSRHPSLSVKTYDDEHEELIAFRVWGWRIATQ